jgi:hypothetical protein
MERVHAAICIDHLLHGLLLALPNDRKQKVGLKDGVLEVAVLEIAEVRLGRLLGARDVRQHLLDHLPKSPEANVRAGRFCKLSAAFLSVERGHRLPHCFEIVLDVWRSLSNAGVTPALTSFFTAFEPCSFFTSACTRGSTSTPTSRNGSERWNRGAHCELAYEMHPAIDPASAAGGGRPTDGERTSAFLSKSL